MADDLVDHKERIAHSWGRINTLEAAIDAFIISGAYKLSYEVDEPTGDGIFFLQLARPIPKQFAIETGSIAHELRATLDGLACTLAVRNGRSANQVYFPICADEAEFLDRQRGGAEKIKKLSPADQAEIWKLKPWALGNPLLHSLHIVDRTRKHQRLIAVGTDTGLVGVGLESQGEVRFLKAKMPIKEEPAAFMRISKGSYMNLNIGVDVCFSEPAHLAKAPVVTVLGEFASLTNYIVEIFD